MTIDERLSAVTMNLELTARDVAELQESVAALRVTVAEMHGTFSEIRGTFVELRGTVADMRSSIDALTVGTGNLLTICQSHDRRLDKLEAASR